MNDRILMLICAAIVPLTALAAGAWMYFFTPGNHLFGYHTSLSQKNALTWTFANRHSGRLMFFGSIVMLPVSLLVMLFVPDLTNTSYETVAVVLYVVQAVALLCAAAATEIALHRHFDRNGNPK